MFGQVGAFEISSNGALPAGYRRRVRMTVYRGSRLHGGSYVDDAVKKKIDAVARLLDAHSKRGPFVLEAKPLSPADMAAAARWIAGVRKGQATYRAITGALRSSAQTLSAGSQQRPQSTWESLKAGGRGAVDSLPWDLGDYLPAAVSAIGAGRLGLDPLAAFHRRLALERGQNRYDEAVHPTARTAGKVAGTVAQLAVPGMAWSRLAAAPRMAQAAPMIFKEGSRLAGYGGVTGMGMQAADDLIQQRLSSLGDYIGSGIGGGVGALTAMYRGPGYVGGAIGGSTSLAQDFLNGRARSVGEAWDALDRAANAAATANLLGLPIAGSFARRANGLSAKAKGHLGERLARQRSLLRGKAIAGEQVQTPVRGGHTRADHVEVNGDVVEGKFGYSHGYRNLQGRQAQAYRELPLYRVDHFTPNDLAGAIEVPFGALSYQIYDDDD